MKRLLLACALALAAFATPSALAGIPINVGAAGTFSNVVLENPAASGFVSYCGGAGQPVCPPGGPPVQVRWGNAIGSQQSGMGFAPAGPSIATETNTPFALAQITHFNFPISSGTAAESVDFSLTMNVTLQFDGSTVFNASIPIRFAVDETENREPCPYPSAVPCSDALTYSLPSPAVIPGPGGQPFVLNILGFRETASATSPPVPQFISQENGSRSAYLFVSIEDLSAQTIARNDTFLAEKNVPLTVPAPGVAANDAGVDFVQLVTLPHAGSVALSADGGFTYTPPAGFTGPVGFVYLGRTATSSLGLAGVTIVVADRFPPELSGVPGDVTLEATGPDGAAYSWAAPTALDASDGPLPVACDAVSGSTFPLGATLVTCSAADAAGHVASASFTVTVVDTTPPAWVAEPADQTLEATGPDGAAASWSGPDATDAVGGAIPGACDRAAGSTFALGTTTVVCTATDPAGNTATTSFEITVADTTPPALAGVPGDVTLEAGGPGGAAYSWAEPTATDAVAGAPPVTCSPASGSDFPLGATDVTCSATDGTNASSASFRVTVVDTTPPALSGVPDDVTLEATGPSGAAYSWEPPTAADAVAGPVPVTCSAAPGTFALGSTEVTCTATDGGNSASQSFTVTVVDTTAPALTAPDGITVEATGADGAAVVFDATATDAVGPVTVVCSPPSGSTFPIGETTVTCTATDGAGNASSKAFAITVEGLDALLQDLLDLTTGLPPGKSLPAKIRAAQASVAAGRIADACSQLQSFLNEVRAQSGKHLTAAQAEDLTARANRIRELLGC